MSEAKAHSVDWFDESKCDRCGECFIQCPVVNLPKKKAIAEIEALISGHTERSVVFSKCNTCNVCDLVCPQNANPYELILQRFGEKEKKEGLPFFAKLIFPNEPENLWSGLRLLMDDTEKDLLKAWEINLGKKHETIMLTGFYSNLVPYLFQGQALAPLRTSIAGSEMLWGCGGDCNKLGLSDQTRRIVPLLKKIFSEMGVKKIICSMHAEAAMLGQVLPEQYGARFDFEVTPLDEWLLDQMETRKLRTQYRLGFKATVHDHCMSRYLGMKEHDTLRRIVKKCGCSLVEMEHNRDRGLCCGWAATIPTLYSNDKTPTGTMLAMLDGLDRRMSEARDVGADIIVASCPACYLFLNLYRTLTCSPVRVVHPLELVEMAGGNSLPMKSSERSWQTLAVASGLLAKWGSAKKYRQRFFPKDVNSEKVELLVEASTRDALRIRGLARFFLSSKVRNRATRVAIALALKGAIKGYRQIQRLT